VGLFGVVFVFVQSCSLKKLTVREAPPLQPKTTYLTAAGQDLTLDALRGKVVLVNVWGTWCAPCIAEMPSLDRLQDLRGGNDFEVVTISIDRTKEIAAKFFVENDIVNLAPWHDGTFGVTGNLIIRGFPSTVIYDRAGDEIAFFEGDAQWDSPEALALVDYLIDR